MIFVQTRIEGVWKIQLEPNEDERGFFARIYCAAEFAANGLPERFEQFSLSRNHRRGTLRGMHYQPERPETKLVRCMRGAIFDVVIDLRHGSSTRGQWIAEELSAENGVGLLIPGGLAHGFQCLAHDSDVLYQITPEFLPGFGAGVRWNDPAFAIDWPIAEPILSERDRTYPDWGQ